jgi:hypothetical protein
MLCLQQVQLSLSTTGSTASSTATRYTRYSSSHLAAPAANQRCAPPARDHSIAVIVLWGIGWGNRMGWDWGCAEISLAPPRFVRAGGHYGVGASLPRAPHVHGKLRHPPRRHLVLSPLPLNPLPGCTVCRSVSFSLTLSYPLCLLARCHGERG